MTKIRVLVVEDSMTVRKHLIDVLGSDRDLEVVGEGQDGKEAIELCQRLRPDVMTLDMMLPVMTGLAATEYIMAHCPTPILIVSASTNRGELFRTYDALAAGAVDVLEKPTDHDVAGDWEHRFLSTVKLVSKIRVITHVRGKLGARGRGGSGPPLPIDPLAERPRCVAVAIGVSTGGPAAVQQILRDLLDDFVLVSENALKAATRLMIEKTRNLVEPAGAAALAAVLDAPQRFAGRKVAIICSGGNISPAQLTGLW